MARVGDMLGYARVSTTDQDLSGQTTRLKGAGAIRVFEDVVSGKQFERPGLSSLLDYARPGDSLAVARLDRLGRSQIVPPLTGSYEETFRWGLMSKRG